jgi:Protein of unknown function (DUF3667)
MAARVGDSGLAFGNGRVDVLKRAFAVSAFVMLGTIQRRRRRAEMLDRILHIALLRQGRARAEDRDQPDNNHVAHRFHTRVLARSRGNRHPIRSRRTFPISLDCELVDEPSQVVAAEAGITALLEPPRRRFFSRRRKARPPPLPYCENCGATMAGPFCAKCGQHAVDYRRSFGRVFLDVLDSFLNWDSKFFSTIGLLLIRPWRLTIDFLAGKRVRYVHPLRLYLLVSIIFFFGVHLLVQRTNLHGHSKLGQRTMTPEAKAKVEKRIEKLRPDARAEVEAAMSEPRTNKPLLEMGNTGENPKASGFEKWVNERVKEKIGENGVNFKVFFLTLVSNLPAMMFCCVPLFAFVLKILYIRKRFFYIDHLIYALHIHAFAYLAIIIIGFTSWELARVAPQIQPFATAILVIGTILLLFLSIRRVYRQSWFMTVFKFVLGGYIYVVVLLLALAATFFVTLALPT